MSPPYSENAAVASAGTTTTTTTTTTLTATAIMPLTQKLVVGLRSLVGGVRSLTLGPADGDDPPAAAAGAAAAAAAPAGPAPIAALFPKADPVLDGCALECDSCPQQYPRGFSVETADQLYGHVKGWSAHILVATGKTDWKRDVADEKGSVMEAVGRAGARAADGGRVMLSASDMPVPIGGAGTIGYARPTTVLLLPAFTLVDDVTPEAVPSLVRDVIARAPTTRSPLAPVDLSHQPQAPAPAPASAPAPPSGPDSDSALALAHRTLTQRPCPHRVIILLCSQRTRDVRCGQSAPILRRELERHLRPLGLQRDLDDERPGGVGIYFISHVGGHKYSANVMVYRRPDAFGLDASGEDDKPRRRGGRTADSGKERPRRQAKGPADGGEAQEEEEDQEEAESEPKDVGAGQCIWLARVRPEDCENIVRYTVLRGKVVKPEQQLRGGFDRSKGLLSW